MRVAFRATAHLIIKSAILAFTAFSTTSVQAKVQIWNDDGEHLVVSIKGVISDSDAKEFQALTNKLASRRHFTVLLDSEGGNVFSSIQIGRLIRRYDGTTSIPRSSKCYSACALIFIAGTARLNGGELGLHRPYLSSAPQSRETIARAISAMFSQIRSYVAEMGVTDNFFQLMVNTEPANLIVYRYNYTSVIPQVDPVAEELITANDARTHGVSTSEMRKRKRDGERRCGKELGLKGDGLFDNLIMEYSSCWQAMLWGLSEPVYVERNKVAVQKCASSEEEKSILARTPKGNKWDLPFFVQHVVCVRKIMLGH